MRQGSGYRMLRALMLFACLLTTAVTSSAADPQAAFFSHLGNLCGARFEGHTVFPDDPGDAFRDQLLVAHIARCDDTQLHIPFAVGEDTSRTWILTRTSQGLELKHDHRHPDGTPDEVTMYGGMTRQAGTALRQSFPADNHTAQIIPEAATNEWFLILSDHGNTLTYYLERHGQPRFRAVLTRAN